MLKMFNTVPDERKYLKVVENGFTQSDLPEIMSNTDVLVAPSIWYETFGFTVLEALSFGIPVIVSDHVGAKDIVGNAGIIVKAGDISELKNVIEALINDPDNLSKLKDNAKKKEVKTWKQFVDENYELYHKFSLSTNPS